MDDSKTGNAEKNTERTLSFNHPSVCSYDNYEDLTYLYHGFIIRCAGALVIGIILGALIFGFALAFYFGMTAISVVPPLFLSLSV